jgi:hypothetical protein
VPLPQNDARDHLPRLCTACVLRVEEHACEVVDADGVRIVRFAPMFPSPRLDRVSPGHLVAVASAPQGDDAVVWRWYDAVVLGPEGDGSVRLWEPGHGEVVARARPSYAEQPPGARAYASAGLPGAQWWVADSTARSLAAVVELDDVNSLYTENGLWASVFDHRT